MLSFLHSRRVAHDLMVLAVLAMECFFAWRASLMYQFLLTGRVNPDELGIIRWIVFGAVGVFGFTLATHRHYGVEAIRQLLKVERLTWRQWNVLVGVFGAVVVIVAHDLAATIYTVGTVDTVGAWVAVIGMCCLVMVPYLVGLMSHAIASGIEEERAQHTNRKIASWRTRAELDYYKRLYRGSGMLWWRKAATWQPTLAPEPRISPPALQNPVAPEVVDQIPIPEQTPGTQAGTMRGMFYLPDKLQLTIEALTENPNITDAELADYLSLKKPASARYWRLKTQEYLEHQATYAPELPQTTPAQQKPIAPELAHEVFDMRFGNLAALFPEEDFYSDWPHRNGHLNGGSEDANNGIVPFRIQ